jgi:hypothetical protein
MATTVKAHTQLFFSQQICPIFVIRSLTSTHSKSMKTYLMPSNISLGWLSSLFEEMLGESEGTSSALDWRNTETIAFDAYCMILHLKNLWDAKEIHIQHLNVQRCEAYHEVQTIMAYKGEDFGEYESLGVFISPILSEERLMQDKERVKRFYSKYAKAPYDYSSLENIFAELYMNVCQHSTSQGYIFISIPDQNGLCSMIFSDIGVGIVANIKSFFGSESFNTDADAIEYATQLGVTTKSTTQNQGKGLDNLLSQSKGLGASVNIYSGEGLVNQAKVLKKQKSGFSLKGTLVELEFNLYQLPLQEDINDYIGEI